MFTESTAWYLWCLILTSPYLSLMSVIIGTNNVFLMDISSTSLYLALNGEGYISYFIFIKVQSPSFILNSHINAIVFLLLSALTLINISRFCLYNITGRCFSPSSYPSPWIFYLFGIFFIPSLPFLSLRVFIKRKAVQVPRQDDGSFESKNGLFRGNKKHEIEGKKQHVFRFCF